MCVFVICCVALRMRAPEACKPGSADVVELSQRFTSSEAGSERQMLLGVMGVMVWKGPQIWWGDLDAVRLFTHDAVTVNLSEDHSRIIFFRWFSPLVITVTGTAVHIWQQIQKQTVTQRYVLVSYVTPDPADVRLWLFVLYYTPSKLRVDREDCCTCTCTTHDWLDLPHACVAMGEPWQCHISPYLGVYMCVCVWC